MLKLACLASFSLLISGCVTVVPNTRACTAAGPLSAGMICAETLSDKTSELTFDEAIEFLEAQPERPDPNEPGATLPARAGAICQSADDWNKQKTALEQACRRLGRKCSYEVRSALARMK